MSSEPPDIPAWSPLKTAFAVLLALAVMLGLWLQTDTEPAPEPVRYTVVKGDTLSGISRTYHVSVDQLRGWNGIEGDLIEVGQELIVWPELGSAPPSIDSSSRPRSGSIKSASGGVAPLAAPQDALLPLVMPPERACLAGPSEADLADPEAEPSMVASSGLDVQQVRTAMNAFLPRLGRCVPEGDWPSGVVDTELRVACTGRVASVEITDSGGLDAALVSCIAETLRYVPFPAHDMPDGFTFQYPIRFSI